MSTDDVGAAAKRLAASAELVQRFRTYVNEVWTKMGDDADLDELASNELDKIADHLVVLLGAWKALVCDSNAPSAIADAERTVPEALRSTLSVLNRWATLAQGRATRTLASFKQQPVDTAELHSLMSRAAAELDEAARLHEADNIDAVQRYLSAGKLYVDVHTQAQAKWSGIQGIIQRTRRTDRIALAAIAIALLSVVIQIILRLTATTGP